MNNINHCNDLILHLQLFHQQTRFMVSSPANEAKKPLWTDEEFKEIYHIYGSMSFKLHHLHSHSQLTGWLDGAYSTIPAGFTHNKDIHQH